MQESTIPAAVTGLPNATDEVLMLGIRLGELEKQRAELQRKSIGAVHSGDRSLKLRLDKDEANSTDRADAIREMIASVKAETLAGAAVQIIEALSRVSCIEDQFPGAEMPYELKQDFRAVARLLYSALEAVAAAADPNVKELASAIGSPWCNPWVRAEERCKEPKSPDAAAAA